MNFSEKLDNAVKASGSNVVVGLDSDPGKIPALFLDAENPVLEFNREIIRSTKEIVAGYKLNVAFYEFLREKGIEALGESMNEIPEGLISICDAKRGDLDNTTELYARTYFDTYGFDSITVNAYMGSDSVQPFLNREGKMIFILALTSNKSSSEFQKIETGGVKLYEKIIQESLSWGGGGRVGYVFGANHTDEISEFTNKHPEVPVLIPGIGAQGHELAPLLNSIHTERFVINSSRSIIYSAPKGCTLTQFREAVIVSAQKLNSGINSLRN